MRAMNPALAGARFDYQPGGPPQNYDPARHIPFAERVFDVRDWKVEPDGGHFGAWERPEAYAAGLRRAVALAHA